MLAVAALVAGALATPASAQEVGRSFDPGSETAPGDGAFAATTIPGEMIDGFERRALPRIDEGRYRSALETLDAEGYADGMGAVSRSGETETPSDQLRAKARAALEKGRARARRIDRQSIRPRIHGSDDRKPINITHKYPFRAIGHLWSRDGGGWSTCTATLIGPRTLLTAAHCVYDVNGWPNEVLFIPGANGDRAPYGQHRVADYTIMSGYSNNIADGYDAAMPFDVAVLQMEKPIGGHLGWFGYGRHEPGFDYIGNIVGYPGDKPTGTMWRTSCDFLVGWVQGVHARHLCDTVGGYSGSGVYDYDRNGPTRTILGVHIAGSSNYAIALRFNDGIYEWVRRVQQGYED